MGSIDPEIAFKYRAQKAHRCQGCGRCCKESEEILVTPIDLQRLADHFHISIEKARAKFTKRLGQYRGIKRTKPCMFYDETNARCRIYTVRPQICRDYPFWCQIGSDRLDIMGCPAGEDALAQVIAEDHKAYISSKQLVTMRNMEGDKDG